MNQNDKYKTEAYQIIQKVKRDKKSSIKLEDATSDKIESLESLQWYIVMLNSESRLHNLGYYFTMNYNNSEIIIKEEDTLRKSYYFEIPYGRYDIWCKPCFEINKIVGQGGMVVLYVSNIPYYLKSFMLIECVDNEEEEVKVYCKNQGIELKYDKGNIEFLSEMGNRMWNSHSFFPTNDFTYFKIHYEAMFEFQPESKLNELGYYWNHEQFRPSVFISYTWKNSDIVDNFSDNLQEHGVNIFIDKKSIDFGDHILESILAGLKECSLALFFISEDFKESIMAKNELKSIWNEVLNGKKEWILIKLDDVNPNDIFYSLNQIKWFDYRTAGEEELIKVIKRKLEEVRK